MSTAVAELNQIVIPANVQLAEAVAEYYDDPLGFVRFAYPWGEPGPLEQEIGPDDNQCEFLNSLGAEVKKRKFDGSTPVMPIQMAETSGHGTGKLQPKSAIVETPQGRRVWGEINVGDFVFGANGIPTPVMQRHENGVKAIYRITFDDDSIVLCGLDHLWNVRGRTERRNNLATWRTMTTEEIMDCGTHRSNGTAQAKQWEIPIQGSAQFREREIDLPPYFVGIWLGDGCKGTPKYTKPYPELVARLRDLGLNVSEAEDGKTKYVLGISHLLRDAVFQLGSPERYIPEDYKYNSVENRRELLRGLLDSDGECSIQGSIGYSSTSKALAEDVIWLVRSLGGKAQLQDAIKHGWYPDANGDRVECRDCYRITIQLDWNPFTLKHRKDNWKPCEPRYLKRWIESIEYSHEEDSMCITVEAEDGLYLANDFVVTHNSAMGAWITNWISSTRPHSKGTVTAGTFTQLETRTWAAIRQWTNLCITSHWFDIQARGIYHKKYRDSWYVTPQTCKEENAQSFAGQHAATSTSWYLFDEASEVPDGVFTTAYGGMTDGEPMFFVWGQLVRNTGEFYRICCGDLAERWNHRRVDSCTSRFTNKELIEQWRQDYGEDSDHYRVRVLGYPPSASELQYIDKGRVDAARNRKIDALHDDPIIAGFDVSGGGKAWNVIRFRKGLCGDLPEFPPIRIPGEHDPERSQRVGICAELLRDRRPGRQIAAMFVDSAFGAVIVSRLRQLGFTNVYEVNFGAASPDPHYLNMRAYMWGKAKDWLLLGSLPKDEKLPEQHRLGAQLCLPGYHINNSGKLVIESKADLQARGESSPDDADSFCLSFSQPVAPPKPKIAAQSHTKSYTAWS